MRINNNLVVGGSNMMQTGLNLGGNYSNSNSASNQNQMMNSM